MDIERTENGIIYSYEGNSIFNKEFIANCKEDDEEFYCSFFTADKYTEEQLQEIGEDIASLYGAECIDVGAVVKHDKSGTAYVN